MNITFLIGNGFDLNLGLKTSYKDFYKYYISKEPKDFIAKNIDSNYELWADLELGLGYFLKNCTKKDIDTYLSSKLLLEDHLTEYLINENSRIAYLSEEKTGKELAEFLKSIDSDFSEKDKAHYKALINNSSFINYKFITFNYTDVLDRIVSFAKSYLKPFLRHNYNGTLKEDNVDLPLHINGDLDDGLILGIDNKLQICNTDLQNETSLTKYIIKEQLNTELGNRNISKAKDIIDKSKIICLFGLSIGDTDNYWWHYLMQWILKDSANRLVIFVKDNSKVSKSASSVVLYRDKKRTEFSNHNKSLSSAQKNIILDRIIIVRNSDIFSFKNITLNKNKTEIYKNDILNCIKTHNPASINDIKSNTPFSISTIRKYLKELENEEIITFEYGTHKKKLYKLT